MMHKSISKMEILKKSYIDLPECPHSVIICIQTGCVKTEFVMDLLESEYASVFEHIVIFCPKIE